MVVWAWERPEDLRDLDERIGVAFLAQTITVIDDRLRVEPRRQPLRVSPGATLVAVTRIEVSGAAALSTVTPPLDALAAAVTMTAALPRVAAIQIDFDATASQRSFYRHLLHRLGGRLPPTVPISITALASWCFGDDWLDGLPIDEAVPMLFRMGPANEPFRRVAAASGSASRSCRSAVGISLDEPIDMRPEARRVYVFNPRPWTGLAMRQARNRVAR